MLGAGNVDYCVLLGIASWLEFSLAAGWQDSSNYLFCYDGLNNHDAIKRAAHIRFVSLLLNTLETRGVPVTLLMSDFVGRIRGCKIATFKGLFRIKTRMLRSVCARVVPSAIK